MNTTLIAQHTIPGTSSTVTVERRSGQSARETYFIVTREAGPGFNYLSCGRKVEQEARTEANALWADAVKRRNAHWAAEAAQRGEEERNHPVF